MIDCVKLAAEIVERLNDEDVSGPDQCATLITALALVATVHKVPGCSVNEVKAKCVDHIQRAIDLLHVAREASAPAR